ncbi:hypothetical protein GPL17_13150 [Bradyrhizobium yuanmingense]|uniref:hypothetical protein n=1 Tax=Bradyrhizobium yuanmingense TaxID=108015 RepID=UPI0012FA6C75|nr:hypothetical protein [Bradyrhizobium yuanmingense]MVT51435.1 hypothetical protein [Bradyrhizobium yuanmingense]
MLAIALTVSDVVRLPVLTKVPAVTLVVVNELVPERQPARPCLRDRRARHVVADRDESTDTDGIVGDAGDKIHRLTAYRVARGRSVENPGLG